MTKKKTRHKTAKLYSVQPMLSDHTEWQGISLSVADTVCCWPLHIAAQGGPTPSHYTTRYVLVSSGYGGRKLMTDRYRAVHHFYPSATQLGRPSPSGAVYTWYSQRPHHCLMVHPLPGRSPPPATQLGTSSPSGVVYTWYLQRPHHCLMVQELTQAACLWLVGRR